MSSPPTDDHRPGRIFLVFLRLGCTSFGGPMAHLGYFQREFVERRRWVNAETFADWIALCQLLPGPMSSQIGMALGWRRGGWKGVLAAWAGFTFPSAALMVLFAIAVRGGGGLAHAGWMTGLKIAAIAIVAQAAIAMARRLCPDPVRAAIAALAGAATLLIPTAWIQVAAILAGALAGGLFTRSSSASLPARVPDSSAEASVPGVSFRTGIACLAIYLGLLLALPLLAWRWPAPACRSAAAFYRAGALVFGGGHVVLPLLHKLTVAPGWLDQSRFLAGYGAAQALPGPLFAFSAFLGTAGVPGGWTGGLLALIAIYLPAALVLFGAVPFWAALQRAPAARHFFAGANAAVVGLLAAALYSPLGTSTITGLRPLLLATAAFVSLQFFKLPSWLIVIGCVVATAAFSPPFLHP